jgi:hypothetical protein
MTRFIQAFGNSGSAGQQTTPQAIFTQKGMAIYTLTLLLLAACTSPVEEPPAEPALVFAYPLDDVLRLNHIQMKGTHNSYHIQPDSDSVEEWNYTHLPLSEQLSVQGVRQFELDVHYQPETDDFAVFHLPYMDAGTTCFLFRECLEELLEWSNKHRGHHPIFVFIEPKDLMDNAKIVGHYETLDAEILAVWPRNRLLTPADIQGDYPTLAEAVATEGWPFLGAVRGHAVFVFLTRGREPGDHHYEYTHGNQSLDGRTMFILSTPGDPYQAIMAPDNPIHQAAEITAAVEAGFIVRTMGTDTITGGVPESTARQEAALASPAHMLSSDYPVLGIIEGYGLDFLSGTPSRCNPLTAPAVCTSDAIESPAWLQPVPF